jgi:hypothetical protein
MGNSDIACARIMETERSPPIVCDNNNKNIAESNSLLVAEIITKSR